MDQVIGTVKVSGLWWVMQKLNKLPADINPSKSNDWTIFISEATGFLTQSQKWNLLVFREKLSCIFCSWKWKIWWKVWIFNFTSAPNKFFWWQQCSFRWFRASTLEVRINRSCMVRSQEAGKQPHFPLLTSRRRSSGRSHHDFKVMSGPLPHCHGILFYSTSWC